MTDDDILAELGVDLTPKRLRARTPREERIMAGFEDIVKFREEHGRAPQPGDGLDIFERIYAVRLDRLRALPECRDLLAEMDTHGLLEGADVASTPAADELDDSALLAELGIDAASAAADITQLRHVRSYEEKQAAEDVASRSRCEDFPKFKPLFDQVQAELETGIRTTRAFVKDAGLSKAAILPGEFFILGGQVAYVAEVGEPIKAPNGETDARLRVIYSNGTESDLLLRSLQRALYKDDGGRRITEPSAGPLFVNTVEAAAEPDYLPTGTLYVLRSRSSHPAIAAHRDLIHKIGITGGPVESRIAGAADDATYLLADVDVVATYKLYDINRPRLEALIHRALDSVRYDIEIPDRFGKLVRPREWFLVPLPIVDEIVCRIGDGSLVGMVYNREAAALVLEGGS
ncbi:GIY-YIG nuclease family protein [Sphingomonas sp. AR_OL41]|uniref:GIY-YIG nuclease family protein n=1 Tax=Sphingomonas sp. AR_OL41 TaxID=3042729 RepID=UPI0024814850|nr:GIY-YIG nuclease family protein [Sphingomonas sp. AR_OL41]MDH7972510.1 GIY-YIG nuclease family protein [Sphingomonas sp. AR_OL41]